MGMCVGVVWWASSRGREPSFSEDVVMDETIMMDNPAIWVKRWQLIAVCIIVFLMGVTVGLFAGVGYILSAAFVSIIGYILLYYFNVYLIPNNVAISNTGITFYYRKERTKHLPWEQVRGLFVNLKYQGGVQASIRPRTGLAIDITYEVANKVSVMYEKHFGRPIPSWNGKQW